MKKLFIILLVLFAGYFSGIAQKPRFGFGSGLTFANYTLKSDGDKSKGKTKTGFSVSMLLDIPMGKHFSFQPAINGVQKGAIDKDETTGMNIKLTVNSIELPLNFLYNTNGGGTGGNFFIGAGPTIAMAINGYYKIDSYGKLNAKFGNGDDDNLKRMDLGANFLTGYTISGVMFLAANYNMGLSNVLPGGTSEEKLHSSYFGLKLGFFLKGKGTN